MLGHSVRCLCGELLSKGNDEAVRQFLEYFPTLRQLEKHFMTKNKVDKSSQQQPKGHGLGFS